MNHTQNVQFTARVIHSLSVMTSVVHVYFHDKMAAVAHLIGLDQLPIPKHVRQNLHTKLSIDMGFLLCLICF